MNNQSSHLELCPSLESLEAQDAQARVEEFYTAITAPNHVNVSVIAPLVKVSYDLQAPLAIREETEEFGVSQVLYGILRAGNHGFGIVQAYGHKLPENGFKYISRLCQEPYGSNRPDYTAHLREDRAVILGGSDTVTADLNEEGYTIELIAQKSGEVWAKQLEWSKKNDVSFQLITSSSTAAKEDRQSDFLTKEERTWAVPPAFIQRKAARTMAHKKKTAKKSVTKTVAPTSEQPKQQRSKQGASQKKKRTGAFFRREAQQHIFDSLEAGF